MTATDADMQIRATSLQPASSSGENVLAAKYRMPRWFGALPGPRNVPADRASIAGNVDMTSVAVTALSNRDALQALLPPKCSVWGEPTITVTVNFLRNLGWLAGRGYNYIAVTIPVEFRGDEDVRRGQFAAVLWENHADPILTGREELGFPKLYAAIDGPGSEQDSYQALASWEGFPFFNSRVWDVAEAAPSAPNPQSEGTLAYKFIPRCGDQMAADVEYMVFVPFPPPPKPGEGSVTVRHLRGRGEFKFHPARWEDMPTQYPIINRLAALPLNEFLSAYVSFVSMRGAQSSLDGARAIR